MNPVNAMKPIIQVAGIKDREEAALLIRCGVTHLGFPLRIPVHSEDLTDEAAVEIIAEIEPPVKAVLITYLTRAAEIVELVNRLNVPVVQIHGDIEMDELGTLRVSAPELEVWKSLIVREDNFDELVKRMRSCEPYVDGFITDTYDPETGASGATGKTHDWEVDGRLVKMSRKPVILAGGLTPANVKSAVLDVGPAGVDVHTGVEGLDGRKKKEFLEIFVRRAREGYKLRFGA